MIRGVALTASFLLAGAVSALAQTHPYPHPPHPYPHPWTHSHDRSGHVPLDSAQHAAMHPLLLGSWKGAFSSPQGVSSGLHLSVAHDSLRKVTLRMSTDRSIRAGAASNLATNGDKLHWTQDLSGTSCKATAVLTAATPLVPEMMKGRMACEDGEEITFILQKRTG